MKPFNGCKIFSATIVAQRQALGEVVTQWITQMRQRPGFEIVDIVVRQSSDAAYHATSIILFYKETK